MKYISKWCKTCHQVGGGIEAGDHTQAEDHSLTFRHGSALDGSTDQDGAGGTTHATAVFQRFHFPPLRCLLYNKSISKHTGSG
ncbi:hypothetical protein MA03_01610 [Infirmifilum uzonense]|uniref:Uncharacterized protein n=1 Tax=Infirmifilum uzonense TaxID=1550241 RepID=A0A0F7FGI3_9CREN|nr:hypothetical protein MA03_01610 [Infirmifilum uzonense]